MTVDPTLFRKFGVTGGDSQVPTGTLLKNLESLLKQIQGSSGADQVSGLASLEQTIETIEKKGYITEGDIEALRNESSTLAENPKLTPPDTNAITNFISQLNRTPAGTFPVGTNAFLDCSAILELFKITAQITTLLAQVEYKEAMMRVREMELQKEAAQEAANATKAAGVISAQEKLAQATADYAEAGLALASALTTSFMTLGGSLARISAQKDYEQAVPGDKAGAGQAGLVAEQRWNNLTSAVDKVYTAASKLVDASLQTKLATKEIQKSILEAAASFLRTLSDLQSTAAGALGQSISGLDQEIKAFFDNYVSAMRGWGQAWSRG